jgi:hypothetical protein
MALSTLHDPATPIRKRIAIVHGLGALVTDFLCHLVTSITDRPPSLQAFFALGAGSKFDKLDDFDKFDKFDSRQASDGWMSMTFYGSARIPVGQIGRIRQFGQFGQLDTRFVGETV